MKSLFIVLAGCLIVSIMACKSPDQSVSDEVMATGKGFEITRADFDEYAKRVPPYARAQYSDEEILDRLIKSEVLYHEAMRIGLDRDPEVRKRIDDTIRQILQREYYTREMEQKMGIPDDIVEAYYNESKDEFLQPEERKCWHILCRTREDAESARSEIEKGADFRDVAKRMSIDEKTRATNGLMGIFPRDEAPSLLKEYPVLLDTLFLMQPGSLSSVIETDLGFHVLKANLAKRMPYQSLSEVAEEIRAKILVPDSLIEQYYKDNEQRYQVDDRALVRYFTVDSRDKAEALRERILAGESFSDIAKAESMDDKSRRTGGSVGWLVSGSAIREIGENKAFETAVWETGEGSAGPVIATDKGYLLFTVEEREYAGLRPMAEVEESIRSHLLVNAKVPAIESAFEALKKQYEVRIISEDGSRGPKSKRSADGAKPQDRDTMNEEELFSLAQEMTNPNQRLDVYRELLQRFPESKRADESQFMIGFVLSEELGDTSSGRKAYETLISTYPESEWVDDAEAMLSVLDSAPSAPEGNGEISEASAGT